MLQIHANIVDLVGLSTIFVSTIRYRSQHASLSSLGARLVDFDEADGSILGEEQAVEARVKTSTKDDYLSNVTL